MWAMNTIEETLQLMREAHKDQTDKAGLPYHTHPERVLQRLLRRFPDASEAEQHAALLHDVLEDTRLTSGDLLQKGYTVDVVGMVTWLTRPGNLTYNDWIENMAEKAPLGAIRVKLADNEDNSDPQRIDQLPEKDRDILRRYVKAKQILEAALASRFPT